MIALYSRFSRWLALLLTLLSAVAARAQSPTVTRASLSPSANARAAARATSVVVPFSQDIDPATAGNIRIHSQQYRGRRTATAGTSGSTVTLTPTVPATGSQSTDFKPGETVMVTVPATVKSTGNVAANRHVYQFTTAVKGGNATFSTTQSLGFSGGENVALGDVDGDGDLDMLGAVSYNFLPATYAYVMVRTNDGTGYFSGTQDVSVGTNSNSYTNGVTLGDVDGDGDLDLLASNLNDNTVAVRLNDGNGIFSGTHTVSVAGPQEMAMGDVDGDGDLDLLVACYGTAGSVAVRLNDGTGTFSGTYQISVGTSPSSVAVGDVDGDGDLDLLTANSGGGTVSVRLNNGTGTYSGAQEVSVSPNAISVKLGDVDGDSDLDLLAATSSSNVSVRLNGGDATGSNTGIFTGTHNVSVGPFPRKLMLGDMNGDGHLDVITVNRGDQFNDRGSVSVRLNNGSGVFSGGSNTSTGNSYYGKNVAVGDVDGDGDLDMLAGTENAPQRVLVMKNEDRPVVEQFTPTAGAPGTSVVITGENFTGATAVRFNNVSAPGYTVNAAGTQITVTVPASATTGPISVTTPVATGTSSSSFTVWPLLVLTGSPTPVTCNGQADGAASVTASGGTAPYSYSWNTAPVQTGTSLNGLSPGTYTVTVTDNVGQQATRNYIITEPAVLTVGGTQTDVLCYGASTGVATATPSGGNGSYTYSWNTSPVRTTASINNLPAGTYTVTVKDSKNCTATRTFTLTQPASALQASSGGQTDVACYGAATGTATVVATGGTGSYTYTWSPAPGGGQGTATATGLTAQTYTVTVKDANNCSTTQSFTIAQPGSFITSTSSTNATCNGSATGTATVVVGAGSYTYTWSPAPGGGQGTATATGLTAQTYTVTVSNGTCTETRSFNITQPAVLTLGNGGQVNPQCAGANGSATVTVSGGTSGYSYSWLNQTTGTAVPATTATATGLSAGTYRVTVTDARGCVSTRDFTLTNTPDNTLPVAAARNVTVTLGANGTATLAGTDVDNGSTDNCGIASRTLSRSTFGCADVGATTSAAGNALHFNGGTNFVSLPTSVVNMSTTAGTGFTFEAWVNFAAEPAVGTRIFDFGTDQNNYMYLVPKNSVNGKLRFVISRFGEFVVDAASSASLTGWHHYAVTMHKVADFNVAVKLYLDGTQVGSGTTHLMPGNITIGAARLGKATTGTDPNPVATFDEVRLWDVARSAADLNNNKGLPLNGNETGLRAYYPFNQGSAGNSNAGVTTLTDATSNGRHGTLSGFALSGATSNWVASSAAVAVPGVAVTLTVADAAGNQSTATARIIVQAPAPAAPTALSLAPASVVETEPAGTVVGTFTTTDPGACPVQTHTYTLVSGAGATDNAQFSIGTGANAGKLLTNAVFDYETKSSYSIRVRTTDQGGLIFEQAFTIDVTDLVELQVTGLSPARNARAAARTTTVGVTISADASAATAGNIRVFSQQYRGRRMATASVSGGTITLTPTAPATGSPVAAFKPGETVFVTVPSSVRGTAGQAVVPHVFQFTAAATGGSGIFGGGSDPAVGSSAYSVAVGDVDADGDLDLLTANTGSNTVSVRLNNGTGSYSAPATNADPAVGSGPRSVALGDVDGDGDLDFVTANNYGSSVSVRLNNGAGNFTAPATNANPAVGNSPISIALGDVDGDGDLDLLTANNSGSTVSVRLNDGAGSFAAPATNANPAVGGTPTSVTLGDVDADGDLDLLATYSVFDYDTYTNSGWVSVRLNNGAGSFSGGSELSVAGNAQSVTLGDVDGDGDLDLLTASNDYSNTVSVRLNNGAGTFSGGSDPSVGNSPSSVALGDVDGDGDLDVVTVNNGYSGTASVRLNNGAGSFSAAAGPNVALGTYAYGLALGDVDGDGDLDIVTANNNYSSSTASVRLNLGAPTITSFTPTTGSAGTVVTITGTNFANVTAVQFNGVAASSYTVNSTTQITATVPAAATTGPVSVVTSAGTATSTGSFTVLPRLTVTSVSPARNARAAARTAPVSVTFSGDVDAATAGHIRVFSQQYRGRRTATAGTSGSTVTLTPTVPATGSQSTDFKPGETVMVTVPAAVRSTIGQATLPQVYQFTAATTGGSGNFGGGSDPAVAGSAQGVAVGDVDVDGDLDLLTINTNNSVSVRLNDGAGSYVAPATNPNPALSGTPSSVTLGDVDADGDLDLLATYSVFDFDTGTRYGMVSVRLNNGAGSFSGGSDLSLSGIPSGVAVGDVDADGDLDLLASSSPQNQFGGSGNGFVSVRLNNGAGSFSPTGTDVSVGVNPSSVAVGDVDADGDLDLLATNQDNNTVSVRLNNGTGSFTAPATNANPAVGNSPRSLVLGDLDGDGDLDLLTANYFANSVSVRLNNGGGNFTAPAANADPAVGSSPISIALGDVDGDGDLDLLTANNSGSTVSVRLNDGAGSYSAPTTNTNPAVGGTPTSVTLGDVDADGDLDFVTANGGSSTVSVRLNLPAPTITSFTPPSGSAGTVVTITGTNFSNAAAVAFNGVAASFTLDSNAQITATVPVGATSGPISVTTPMGVATSSQAFYVNLTISTAGQTVGAGTYNNVTITGTGVATLGGTVQVLGTFEVQNGGQLNTACQPLTGAGSFVLNAGATLVVCDPAGLSLTGSTGAVQVAGTRTFSPGANYVYNGSAAQVTGSGLPASVRSFTLDNAQGATLSGNLTIASALTTTTGPLRTASHTATLSSTATLTESATSYVTGTVETTRDVSTPGAAESFGGLGLTLTPDNASTALPGSTLVRRVTGTTLAGQGTSRSIRRYYDIEPTVNSGLNTTLVFGYLDAELDGASEAGLGLFRSATGLAGPWQPVAHAAQNPTDNTVTATGVAHFSIWTLSSTATPLPVVLADFTAVQEGSRARLRWSTAQEKNNDRFEVEASADGQRFARIGTVAGQGTTTSRHDYQLADERLLQYGANVVYYRLKQIDHDGTASYSSIRAVQVSGAALATGLVLFPTAPAPGQPVHYRYQGPALPGNAQLEVYDALGRCVGRQPAAEAGTLTLKLAPGWYVVRLRTAGGTVQDRFYQP